MITTLTVIKDFKLHELISYNFTIFITFTGLCGAIIKKNVDIENGT